MATNDFDYSLGWILPFVRESLRGRGNFTYGDFVIGLWMVLEKHNVNGIERVRRENDYSSQIFHYEQSPYELRAATEQALFHLFFNGFVIPQPPSALTEGVRFHTWYLTKAGLEWAKGVDPLPEDVDGYMGAIRSLVTSLDPVVEQYVREGVYSFDRRTMFASAVMVGAAAEKQIYLLADAMRPAIKNASQRAKFQQLVERRKLAQLFDSIKDFITKADKTIPFSVSEGSLDHMDSLFTAIRVQRNDAVHPANASVSASAVRLTYQALPFALKKAEELRLWFIANPNSI